MRKILALLVPALLAFSSCEGLIEIDTASFEKGGKVIYKADEEGNVFLTMPFESSRATIIFEASDNWEAALSNPDAAQWCAVTPSEGGAGQTTVFVSVSENGLTEQRNVNITLSCGESVKTIAVSQRPAEALSISQHLYEVPETSGSITVKVKSSVDYTVEIDEDSKDWIHENMDTKGLATYNRTFNLDRNFDIGHGRTGKINFKSMFGTETVEVVQAPGKPCIEFDRKEYRIPAEGGTIEVHTVSNVNYSYKIVTGAIWLKDVTTKSSDSRTLVFSAEPFDEMTDREAYVEFTDEKLGFSETLKIVQNKKEFLTLSSTGTSFSANGGEASVVVTSNCEINYEIINQLSWIKFEQKVQSGNGYRFYFLVEKNTSRSQRSGGVRFTAGSLSKVFSIQQKQ